MTSKPKTKSRGASMERTAWRGFAMRLINAIQQNPAIDAQEVADRIMAYSQGRQRRVMAWPLVPVAVLLVCVALLIGKMS